MNKKIILGCVAWIFFLAVGKVLAWEPTANYFDVGPYTTWSYEQNGAVHIDPGWIRFDYDRENTAEDCKVSLTMIRASDNETLIYDAGIQVDHMGYEFEIEDAGDYLFIITETNGSESGRLVLFNAP